METSSFLKLRRLAIGFEHVSQGRPTSRGEERAMVRTAAQLGGTALGMLRRELLSPDEGRARWAYTLLAHLGRQRALRHRVVADLEHLIRRPGAGDMVKLRALTLLAELDAELPDDPKLVDPLGARRDSMRQLALCLETAGDVARAADHLLAELPFEDVLELCDDLVEADPASALILIDELLVRDDVDQASRQELRRRRTTACQVAPRVRARPNAMRGAVRARIARHDDGRVVVLCCARQPRSRPARRRLLCALVAAEGALLDACHAEDLTAGAIERQFAAPLAEQGFTLDPAPVGAAREVLAAAARLAIRAGRALPRAFYLGRDLVGLRDEHLEGTAHRGLTRSAIDLAAQLDRAIELLAEGEPAQARALLDRYVADAPSDAEGHAQLGLCLVALGEPVAALHHLGRATWLAPERALPCWNTAAAAHAAGEPEACLRALRAYLERTDADPGADARRCLAERWIREQERLSSLGAESAAHSTV